MQSRSNSRNETAVVPRACAVTYATDESPHSGQIETWGTSSVIADNPLIRSYPIRPSSSAADQLLRVDGVVATDETRSLSGTEKLSLLQAVDKSFYPTKLESALHADIHDAVLATWSKINPLSAGAVARYRQYSVALKAGVPRLMPSASEPGKGFVLCSVAGAGGNRMVQRSLNVLGDRLKLPADTPNLPVPYWPAMIVQWPSAGTSEQFLANFLSVFDANADSEYFATCFRQNAKAQRRSIYAIGLAAIVNVGVLFVMGACAVNFHYRKSIEILSFLVEFMESSGISVVFVCTSPVYDQLLHMGKIGAALMSGSVEEINWLDTKSRFWAEINLYHYNQSLMWKPVMQVSEDVVHAAAACSWGSRDALGLFYRELHVAAVRHKAREPSKELLSTVSATVMKQSTQLQLAAAQIASGVLKKGKVNSANLWGDFMSSNTYRAARSLDE